MKKILLFAAVLVFQQTVIQAQPAKLPRWSIGLSGGLAIPVGPFAGIETIAGHADTHPGPAAEFSVAYHISRYFSVEVAAGGQLNNGEGIPYVPQPYSQPAGTAYKDNDWKLSRVLGGGTFNIPLRKNGRLNLFIRELVGAQKTRAADVYKTIPVNPLIPGPSGNRFIVTYPGPSFPWTFTWETDAGVSWKAGKNWALVGYAGISGASPSKNLTYLVGGDVLVTERSVFPTTTVHVNGGIVYYFPY